MKINKHQEEDIKIKANKVLFNTVFGTVLPVIIGATILILFSQYQKFTSFIEDGTFCLFSASLITTAMYIMDDNAELIRTKWDKFLHQSSKPLWIIVATIFGLLFAKEQLAITIEVNGAFLWIISILAFLISIITLHRALLLEGKANPPSIDAKKIASQGVGEILDNLE
tara:strand:- start:278593 stop:279099 length:507 start_codon:yes stop_codon:yes gene_type:complete